MRRRRRKRGKDSSDGEFDGWPVPVVILAAVDSSGAGETGMDEGGVADATDEAVLVPRSVGHSHDITIRNG